MSAQKNSRKKAPLQPTGIPQIDLLAELSDEQCTIDRYVEAVSAYVRKSRGLEDGPKKAGQIRLSNALGRALIADLKRKLPSLKNAVAGERKVSGALRTVNADVSQIHETDGLRLAVELKPVNLAVGRAIWNRFGDIRTFAVNLHLKFPFCVVGGVLVIPVYEETGTKEAAKALEEEELDAPEEAESLEVTELRTSIPGRKSTVHLIERAIARLVRAGGRKTEGDAPHLLEGIAVVVYDPETGKLDETIPQSGTGLRWHEFIDTIAATYNSRFED